MYFVSVGGRLAYLGSGTPPWLQNYFSLARDESRPGNSVICDATRHHSHQKDMWTFCSAGLSSTEAWTRPASATRSKAASVAGSDRRAAEAGARGVLTGRSACAGGARGHAPPPAPPIRPFRGGAGGGAPTAPGRAPSPAPVTPAAALAGRLGLAIAPGRDRLSYVEAVSAQLKLLGLQGAANGVSTERLKQVPGWGAICQKSLVGACAGCRMPHKDLVAFASEYAAHFGEQG